MNKDLFYKIALALLAYHHIKHDLKIPPIVGGEEAVDIIKRKITENMFSKTLCAGGNDDLLGMAEVLNVPQKEFLNFCKEIYTQMNNEMRYLASP